jgi:hypothetical protein
MLKPCVILLTLLLWAFPATTQESQAPAQAKTPSSSTIPAEAAHQPDGRQLEVPNDDKQNSRSNDN